MKRAARHRCCTRLPVCNMDDPPFTPGSLIQTNNCLLTHHQSPTTRPLNRLRDPRPRPSRTRNHRRRTNIPLLPPIPIPRPPTRPTLRTPLPKPQPPNRPRRQGTAPRLETPRQPTPSARRSHGNNPPVRPRRRSGAARHASAVLPHRTVRGPRRYSRLRFGV